VHTLKSLARGLLDLIESLERVVGHDLGSAEGITRILFFLLGLFAVTLIERCPVVVDVLVELELINL